MAVSDAADVFNSLLLGMYFENKLVSNEVSGFQTTQLPLILKLSQDKSASKNNLVEHVGLS